MTDVGVSVIINTDVSEPYTAAPSVCLSSFYQGAAAVKLTLHRKMFDVMLTKETLPV